jgi:importin-5
VTDIFLRQHPAVTSQPAKIFHFVAQALESDVLNGQTETRVVNATKTLLQATNTDPSPLLQQFPESSQRIIRGSFG